MNLTIKELRTYFYSPVAYIVMVVFLIVGGVLFWSAFFTQNQAEMRSYFQMLPWVLTFIIPAITMRLFSEERKTGSFEILVTLPIGLDEIVLAKFISAIIFIKTMLSFIFLYAISVELVGDLDWGPVLGGWIGAVLLSCLYVSIGLFSSSLTQNQIIAFLIGLVICLFFFLVDKFFIFLPTILVDFFNYFSSDKHFRNISKGMIDSRDFIYFILFSFLFLLATHEKLNQQFLGNIKSEDKNSRS